MKFISYSKRALALLLVLSMLVVTCACGNGEISETIFEDTDTESDTESDTATSTETVTETETETVTETVTETQTETETVTETDTETITETVTEEVIETETVTEPITETVTPPVTESVTEPITESVTDPATETDTETNADTQTETAVESETESVVDTETAADTETATETESDTTVESESETETESETKKDDGLLDTDILISAEVPFRIVYADGYKSLANKVAVKIMDLDKNYKAGKYPVKLDTKVAPDGTPEILIGETNRTASAKAKNMVAGQDNAYAVYTTDNTIAVYAPTEKGLEMAVINLLTSFSKKGESVVYNNLAGSYTRAYDSNTIANELMAALKSSASNKPVINISIATQDKILNASIKGGNPCQNCYSVTKVYCVTAIGILYDQGKIKTTDTIGDIFASEIKAYGIDASKWADITIHDVMRHRAGFVQGGFLDIDSQDATKWASQDYLKLVLEAELTGNKDYKYTDGAFYLISRVVSKISGKNLDEFLAEHLFNKTNCREYAFASCPQGYPIGATGLYIRSEDVAKLGRIYLDGGKYNGNQIISQKWIDLVISNGYELGRSGTGYAKGGMRGQNLYINFDKNIAVAWHSYEDNDLGSTLSNYMK